MSADSSAQNVAVSEALDLPLFNCLAHILYNIFQAITKDFKLFELVTLGLSSVISSGGGTRRPAALRDAGLSRSKLHCSPTRWNQLYDTAMYLRERDAAGISNFEKVRDVLGSDAAFAGSKAAGKAAAKSTTKTAKKAKKAAAGDDDEEEGEGEDVQVTKTVTWKGKPKLASQHLSDVKAAYEADVPVADREYYGELELELIHELAGPLAKLITMSSAEVDTVDVDSITSELQDFRRFLESRSKEGRQLATIQAAAIAARAEWSESEIESIAERDGYIVKLQEAAKMGLAAYDRLVPKLLDNYRRRLRFEPRFAPESLPAPPGPRGQWTLPTIQDYFGCPQAGYTLKLLDEWDAYSVFWNSAAMTPQMKKIPCSVFWSLPTIKQKYPALSLLGQWWGLVSVSKFTVER